ncbi:PREDICTED: coiled-coil domain-containing protein 122 [Cyprinodon variegatus]|nr:PREDICTED: coiled-coil domain-containing protein 122 [Cyprinodon variegatus]
MSEFVDNKVFQEAVKDVSQQNYTKIQTLKEKQLVIKSMQETLADVKKKCQHAKQEVKSKSREIQLLEGQMDHLERQRKVLHDRCASINKGNIELQMYIQEEVEDAQLTLGKFSMYREKMKGHRNAVLQAACQTETHRELEEKKMLVWKLKQEKEQLREDLENPNGNVLQTAKGETDSLKREISERSLAVAAMTHQLKKELDTNVKLKKDIEIQNRRHEAIVKRLRCQLSRTQAVHRQTLDEILQLQQQLTELKGQQHSSEDW